MQGQKLSVNCRIFDRQLQIVDRFLPRSAQIWELENSGIISRQVLSEVPGRRSKTGQTAVLLESDSSRLVERRVDLVGKQLVLAFFSVPFHSITARKCHFWKMQSIALIPDSVIPEFAHKPDREFQSSAETAPSMFCTQSVIRIYRISYIPDSKS